MCRLSVLRETDETITEPQFVNLSYIQAQYDYLMGNYPVVREDAAQLCALQMQAEYGSSLMDSEDEVAVSIEKYIAKQVGLRYRVFSSTHPGFVGLAKNNRDAQPYLLTLLQRTAILMICGENSHQVVIVQWMRGSM